MILKLVDLYEEREDETCLPKISRQEAIRYFSYMWQNSLISVSLQGDLLEGYVEYWRLTPEQLGRKIIHAPFNIYDELLISGPICYLADTYIRPEFRNKHTVQSLKQKFFKANEFCEYFVGTALRKRCQPIKVFKRQEAYSKWAYKVTTNGIQ